jgi:malate dehydrogenase (oxaloacetate-decarboxylating)
MDKREIALQKHAEWHGKLEVVARASVDNKEALSIAYTPGVAEPCLEISRDVDLSYTYTRRWNMVAVVTDGTALSRTG